MNLSLESYIERLEMEGWTLIEARESSADLARPIGPRTIARLRLEATAGGKLIEEREDVDVADYDRSIELDHSDAAAYYGRAVCLDVLGDRTLAIADYGKVIQLDPWHENAFYRRGVARAGIGDAEQALTDLKRALSFARDPDDRDDIRELIDELHRSPSEPSAPIEYDSLGVPSSPILPVPRQSVWPMVLLEFATLGIYGTYWYFSRRKSLNALSSDQQLPEALIVMVLLAAIASVVLTVVSFGPLDASTVESLESIFGLLDLGIGAAFLFFAFRVRGILRDHLAARGMDDTGISGLWTFLFNFIYLQYKINQIRGEERLPVAHGPGWGVPTILGVGVVAALLAVLFVPGLSSDGLSEAEEHTNRGIESASQERWEQAIAEFDRAIELDPSLVEAYINRGSVYNQLGEYDRALGDHDRAIELDPDRVEAYNNRGIAYASMGQYDQALADLDKAIELGPDDWQPYFVRGIVYTDLGDNELASADLQRALLLIDDPLVRFEIQGIIDGLGDPLQEPIGSDEDAITEVLEEMVAALNDRDFEALAPLITANAILETEPIPEALREALEFAEKIRGPYAQVKSFKIISVMVFGDEAIATASRIGDGGETVQEVYALVKWDGRWLVNVIPGL